MAEQDSNFRGIIRIAGADIDGNLSVEKGLRKIYGVGFMFSNAICNAINIDANKQVGKLSQEEVNKINEAIKDPRKFSIPNWLLNRRKDFESGEDKHLVFSDLKLQRQFDIKRLGKIKSYRGLRHAVGLPVRGQRTRSNFRSGKTVGVRKKGVKMTKETKKEEKK